MVPGNLSFPNRLPGHNSWQATAAALPAQGAEASTKREYMFRLLVKFLDRLTSLRGVGNSGHSITDQLADERRWQWFVEGQMKSALGAAIRFQFFAEAVKKRSAEWHNA